MIVRKYDNLIEIYYINKNSCLIKCDDSILSENDIHCQFY